MYQPCNTVAAAERKQRGDKAIKKKKVPGESVCGAETNKSAIFCRTCLIQSTSCLPSVPQSPCPHLLPCNPALVSILLSMEKKGHPMFF